MNMESCTYFAELAGNLETSEEFDVQDVDPLVPFSGYSVMVDGKRCEIYNLGAATHKTTKITTTEVEE